MDLATISVPLPIRASRARRGTLRTSSLEAPENFPAYGSLGSSSVISPAFMTTSRPLCSKASTPASCRQTKNWSPASVQAIWRAVCRMRIGVFSKRTTRRQRELPPGAPPGRHAGIWVVSVGDEVFGCGVMPKVEPVPRMNFRRREEGLHNSLRRLGSRQNVPTEPILKLVDMPLIHGVLKKTKNTHALRSIE